ncbi:hypothetical protein ACFV8Z_04495 [Streptomyces sp. NPDC059837]|uniref:hypothetical protein n=1 Tax=unclassified Streptomyces TaxID=2593676 RepID=UPI003667572E
MIMEVLGHSSIRVTMDIYTFVRLDSQRSIVSGMPWEVAATARTVMRVRPVSP